jgi:putative nucleotidyltransferase with HDIG domain
MTEYTLKTPAILARVKTLKALSPGAQNLLCVVGQPACDIEQVVAVIESDPALTVNVLRAVNAAAMALHREITTIREAIIYLGKTRIIGIALTASSAELFNDRLAGYRGTRGELGRHCLWTATAARELARFTNGKVDANVAFTAGLLHDIGKAVISDFLAEALPEGDAGPEAIANGCQLALERSLLGTDHSEVGRALADKWRVPAALAAAIEFHHAPAEAPDEHRVMAYVVHLADMLAMMFGIGTGTDDLQYDLHPSYAAHVFIDPGDLEGLALDIHLEYKTTALTLFGDDEEATS